MKASVAKLGPNLILLKFKVGTNGLLCLLDFRATHSFVNPKCGIVIQMGGQAHQLAQGAATPTNEVVLKVILECNKATFADNSQSVP